MLWLDRGSVPYIWPWWCRVVISCNVSTPDAPSPSLPPPSLQVLLPNLPPSYERWNGLTPIMETALSPPFSFCRTPSRPLSASPLGLACSSRIPSGKYGPLLLALPPTPRSIFNGFLVTVPWMKMKKLIVSRSWELCPPVHSMTPLPLLFPLLFLPYALNSTGNGEVVFLAKYILFKSRLPRRKRFFFPDLLAVSFLDFAAMDTASYSLRISTG